jgi:hypothetical protein
MIVDAQLSAPTRGSGREVSSEECAVKAVHCQELAAQAEDLSMKLLYLDLADLWEAIQENCAQP